jgi:TetR/AcrR family transcriptional regulator, repressor of fatR-cypB operon
MRKADPDLHKRRRQQIIDAARVRFIANGFHQTGVQDIATTADISLGLLYRYFKNKDALILEVARRDVDAIVDAINAMPNTGSDADAVPHLWGQHMRDFVLAVASDKSEIRLLNDMQSEAARNPELLRQMQIDDARLTTAIEQKLVAQQSAGSLNLKLDAAVVSIQLTTIFDGMLVRMASATAEECEKLGDILSAWVRNLFEYA